MPDTNAINMALASLRTATEIARIMKDAGPSFEEAERRFKFADLINALADAKIGIAELKDSIESKEDEIRALKNALSVKKDLKHTGIFYFAQNDPTPFCPRCLEKDGLAMHVSPEVWNSQEGHYCRVCPDCKAEYKTREANYDIS